MKLSATRIKSGIGLLCIMLTVGIAAITQRAQTAFAQEQGVSRFTPILMPESGTLVVPIEQSITVDQLRGKTLDQSPPKKLFSAAYEGNHGTRVASGNIPYMSNNLEPFQFDHFTVEWNYGGWHTREMRDYALLHGFNLAFLYSQSANEVPVAPSEYLQWDQPQLG